MQTPSILEQLLQNHPAEKEKIEHAAAKAGLTLAQYVGELLIYQIPSFLTRERAARRMGVHPRTIDKWIKKGMPHVKLGATVRIPTYEFHQWIKTQTSPSPSTPEPPEDSLGSPTLTVTPVAKKCRKPKAASSNSSGTSGVEQKSLR